MTFITEFIVLGFPFCSTIPRTFLVTGLPRTTSIDFSQVNDLGTGRILKTAPVLPMTVSIRLREVAK